MAVIYYSVYIKKKLNLEYTISGIIEQDRAKIPLQRLKGKI